MPPRERSVKGKPGAGSSKQSEPSGAREEPAPPRGEEVPRERRRRRGPQWRPVFRRLGIFCVILLIPFVLNYAALNQEHKALLAQGEPRVVLDDL